MPTFDTPEDASDPLTRLLLTAVPENKHGSKTVTHLALLMKLTRAGVYKWITQQKIPPERVMQIVEISRITGYDDGGKAILGDPRVKRDEFDEFVYKS